jgi:hypothetical protein
MVVRVEVITEPERHRRSSEETGDLRSAAQTNRRREE